MTTKEAANRYLQQHLLELQGRPVALHNPHGKPIEELPLIIGFNKGNSSGWLEAIAISEDGVILGGHTCSDEAYMPFDLGVLEHTAPNKHEKYREHYPDGYLMAFVGYAEVIEHVKLQAAFNLHKEKQCISLL